VCNFENIEHLHDPAGFVKSAARVLAPEGVLLCSTPDRAHTPPFVNGRPANPFHVFEWYRDEFAELLAAGFREVHIKTQVKSHSLKQGPEGGGGTRSVLGQAVANRPWNLARRVVRRAGRLIGLNLPRPQALEALQKVAGLCAPLVEDFPIV